MNTDKPKVSIGDKAIDCFGNVFTIVSEEFINHPENTDVWTCSPSYAEQEIYFGRMQITK